MSRSVVMTNQNNSTLTLNNIVQGSASAVGGPVWFTQDYLEHCLRTHYNDEKLRITQMDSRPALGKGENYGGVLTRCTAHYTNSQGIQAVGKYIVKTTFEGDAFACEKMAPFDMFNREMEIYQKVLPKLNGLLQEIGDVDEQIFAETVAVDYDRSALIFEDLNVRGFVMPDRLQGMDMKLCRILMRKLAKMHATSAVLNERENGSLEHYDRGMFNRYTDNYAPLFVGLLEACTRRVSQWPGYERYAKKLNNLKPMYMELGKRVFDTVDGHLNVLAHGDLWTNNVMVKYDAVSGEAVDVIIIDFQYSVWSSPAVDLFYCLNASLPEEMHLHRQDELIQCYYDTLAETLGKLLFTRKIPSLHQFHLQLEAKLFYAFHTSCFVLAVQRNDETDDADFNALMNDDQRAINFKDTCYKNPYCQRMVKQLLPVYERKGLLEPDQ